ncbi:cobaltochelatase subunit CobN [Methylobacterium sp. J-067]|uniref:cobaltochelatase subunit CobN n=1 Tax=Methylobacterium sp. J-067 TaxID=2836648 RepID=UPI001FB93D15|nr:cobaltochelatase subunit CobN [Methylobacterium sp. J-067]MCJ2025415.1 cobaltochelatase subunit CobN [Methylobacterium sp. J-067]
MHLLRVDTVSLDEGEAAIDLGQEPGDLVILSFTDSDLAGLARAHASAPDLPSLRLAKLAKLRHPLSVDLYVEKVIARARAVVIRCLGGLDYWRYGVERCADAARAHGVVLAVLPGDDRPDPRLAAFSTDAALAEDLDGYFRAGGPENLRRLFRRLAAHLDGGGPVDPPQPLPRGFAWCPGCGPVAVDTALAAGRSAVPLPTVIASEAKQSREAPYPEAARRPGLLRFARNDGLSGLGRDEPPLALLLVYRSAVLGGDTAPFEALALALQERGIGVLTLAVSSLKDPEAVAAVKTALAAQRPDIVIAATAFSARDDAGFVLDRAGCPVLQAFTVGSPRAAWEASSRGLGASDLAMQIALPEFDGRLSGFPIAFKEEAPEAVGFSERRLVPHAEGIAALAERARGWLRLAALPPAERRVAVVMSDYPARGGRAGFAVGLDTPESARALFADLEEAGYPAAPLPDDVMTGLTEGEATFAVPLADYAAWLATLPEGARTALSESWGDPEADPLCRDGAFRFRCVRGRASPLPVLRGEGFGDPVVAEARRQPTVRGAAEGASPGQPPHRRSGSASASFVDDEVHEGLSPQDGERDSPWTACALFLQPDRGRDADRKAGYHDPDRVPTHAYLAFHLGLRRHFDVLVQLGTHGTTEWLPGKAVALSPLCWPSLCVGALPVVYPFVVDDPGEAAPVKRRLGGIALGHLTPTVARAGLPPETARLRELVEEYSAATVLDPRRAKLLAAAILEEAEGHGLLAGAGIPEGAPMEEALTALDAHLCDLGETSFRDELHIFGRAPDDAPEPIRSCAAGERAGLLAALAGRFVPPGPAGSPSRGRLDVMPTGRNLTTLDPRAIPSRAATLLGEKAAQAVVTRYLQDEGAYPARIVMDLWASPTLRTGGEDVAHALSLMGVRPVWDHASTRVTGFEVLPLAVLDRPRIDVTMRVSGAFRDTFPDTLALLDRAVRAVAARDEDEEDNPLAAAARRGEAGARVYGAAPGRYGAGAAALALDGDWQERDAIGRAYLAASGYAYGDREGPDAGFGRRVAQADAYAHAFDVAERDLFDGDAAVDAMGGFAAAATLSGAKPALYSLDVSEPERPKARTAREDSARLIRGRLADPRWIAAQLRHGYRGAQELAQGLDAVFVLAAGSDAVTDAGFEALYSAWIADPDVFERLRAANPAATRAILDRFDEARDRGLWTSRRNALPADALLGEVAG